MLRFLALIAFALMLGTFVWVGSSAIAEDKPAEAKPACCCANGGNCCTDGVCNNKECKAPCCKDGKCVGCVQTTCTCPADCMKDGKCTKADNGCRMCAAGKCADKCHQPAPAPAQGHEGHDHAKQAGGACCH